MVLIPSAWAAAPADVSNYEISIGELNRVRKERPVKKVLKERKKKRNESTAVRTETDAAATAEKADQPPVPAPGVTGSAAPAETGAQTLSGQTGSGVSSTTETPQTVVSPVTIHHDPYSYVITGKRTKIQAVVSSVNSIQAVYCRFRAVENGAYALVPMILSPGTHFTFSAELPGLAPASRSLRYNILAVDAAGKENLSREFVITTKTTSVLPGWQLENSPDLIKIKLENKEKPLEGFSDPGLVVE
jgi:hypothetical protein